jgi:hypothetical protein
MREASSMKGIVEGKDCGRRERKGGREKRKGRRWKSERKKEVGKKGRRVLGGVKRSS